MSQMLHVVDLSYLVPAGCFFLLSSSVIRGLSEQKQNILRYFRHLILEISFCQEHQDPSC